MTSSAFYSAENTSLDKEADAEAEVLTLEQIWGPKQKEQCVKWVENNKYQKICLQFPDSYLVHSTNICDELKQSCDAKFFILADTSYGSCCVDEIAASHIAADSLIHFGNACKSKASRLPVLFIFPRLSIDWTILHEQLTKTFQKTDRVHVYLDIPYQHLADKDYQEELDKINASVTNVFIEDSFSPTSDPNASSQSHETCLFVGQDNQNFFNLSMSVKANKWYIFDPPRNIIKEVDPATTKWIRRRYFYIEKCKDASTLGIVVATLTASGYLEVVKHIQEMARARGIKTHLISVGRINPAKLANFMEIDCFVLIGCPFNNMYTSREFFKPIVSVFEAEMALNPAWTMTMPEKYSTDFRDILPDGELYKEFKAEDVQGNDVSLISGRIRVIEARTPECNANGGTDVLSERKNYQLMAASNGGSNFEDRTWMGLDPALGQTEPAKLEKGRSGIPVNYE